MRPTHDSSWQYFWMGILAATAIAMLLGATVQSNGRYQIAAGCGPNGSGVFAIDTATGVTKAVYVDKGLQGELLNRLGTPFAKIP